MSKQQKKNMAAKGNAGAKEEQEGTQEGTAEEDSTAKPVAPAPVPPKFSTWSQSQKEFLEELKKELRAVEEKIGKEMRDLQDNYEKKMTNLAKKVQKNTEENNTLKNKIGQMSKDIHKTMEEKNLLKNRVTQMEKDVQVFTEEKNALKVKIGQMDKDAQKFTEEKNYLKSRMGQMVKEVQKSIEEKNTFKSRIIQLEKEVQKITEEKNFLKSRIVQMEKEVQGLIEENHILKNRVVQVEANESKRHQETMKQSRKHDKIEENVKYLIGKTTDLENRSRRDHLRIIGLPEIHDQKKSLEIIFQEIVKENCPNILDRDGRIHIERIHRSPPERDPKMKSPRDIIAKFQNALVKEKILLAVRKKQFKYRGSTVRITQDLAASTLKERRAWNMIFRRAKELRLQPRITYPAKLSIILQGKRWTFNEIEDFQGFMMKRPDLNRKFEFQTQDPKKHKRVNVKE
uniref:L1 transposable element RRM domain-containing protein n=1 Tax=Monodelphis domestica TaxID=13616 RepID=K7E173_MONDO